MASACINNVGISPETFMDSKFSSYSWMSPRKSFSTRGEYADVRNNTAQPQHKTPPPSVAEKPEEADLEADANDFGDFEFCLEDNFTMLPADELFLDGKLMPLHLSMAKLAVASSETPSSRVASPKTAKPLRNEISIMDPYLFSPKAPRCTTRWKELLGLKRLYQKEKEKEINQKSNPPASKSLKNLLNRSSKASMSASFDGGSANLPLLKDSENDSISISSSRLSLSSSSSSHEDLPRPSLDTDNKPPSLPLPRVSVLNQQKGARILKPRRSTSSSETPHPNTGVRSSRSAMRRHPDANAGGISMDSPRMNASGKIVFNSLERSCSSPSSYGGPRYKHSSVQRSYSANVVRVTPVLNVTVCSKAGSVFRLFGTSTQPKRDSFGSVHGSNTSKCSSHHQNQNSKHRQGSKVTTLKSEQ